MTIETGEKKLQVKCRFRILSIRKCSIYASYNSHTKAAVTAIVEGDKARNRICDVLEDKIEILSKDNDTAIEQILFSGTIECVELVEEGGYAVLIINAISHTWKMDIQKRSRSFQNTSITYREMAQAVTQEYGASLIWSVSDKPLENPIIQYKETDYQFLQRICSHLQEGITAGDFSSKICIYAGLREGDNIGNIALEQYSYSVKIFKDQNTDKKYMGYQINDMEFVRIGDQIRIQGSLYYVMNTYTEYTQGCLKCNCLIVPKQCFKVSKIPVKTLEGTVITGRILESRQEFVKLHLGIDRFQNPFEAYEFAWKPITGNMLYCMPEAGTKAALYFSQAEECSGEVIYNIRENGFFCSDLADCNNRYFTTKYQKRMYMQPSEMGLCNMVGRNAEIAIKDDSALGIITNHKLSLLAEGQVELKGKNITVTTPKEATFVRKDLLSPTVINLCNAFDSIGKVGSFASNAAQITQKKRKKTTPAQTKEKYSVTDITEDLLSNIPANDMGSADMESVAANIPVFGKVGKPNAKKEKKKAQVQFQPPKQANTINTSWNQLTMNNNPIKMKGRKELK